MLFFHYKPVSNHFCSGGGGGGVKSVSRGDCESQWLSLCTNNVQELGLLCTIQFWRKGLLVNRCNHLKRKDSREGNLFLNVLKIISVFSLYALIVFKVVPCGYNNQCKFLVCFFYDSTKKLKNIFSNPLRAFKADILWTKMPTENRP